MRNYCTIPGCTNYVVAHGLCGMHRQRLRRNGDPLIVQRLRGVPIAERFWPKVNKTETCWLWTAGINADGYGTFQVSSYTHRLAHRIAYELLLGPIPGDLQIDHLCRVRACVNPAHMELVSLRENVARGEVGKYNRDKTHCSHGHPYDDTNTYVKNGRRHCIACRDSRRNSH